jgi:hypothetical protein
MASYADAFGYTPSDFMQLTLPQLNAFARYIEQRDKEMKEGSSSSSSSKSSKNRAKFAEGSKGMSNIGSLEQMISVFGRPGGQSGG